MMVYSLTFGRLLMSSKVQGLCAPTYCPALVERKVKGAIFDTGLAYERYFLAYASGGINDKSLAHVYSCEEIRLIQANSPNWASKEDGKWLIVYE